MLAHEPAARSADAKAPSNRAFGFTVGGILIALAMLRTWWQGEISVLSWVFLIAGAPLVLLALAAPRTLSVANRAWMRLGVLLGHVASPIVMGLVFAAAVIPTGIAARLLGHDQLALRRREAASYWRPHRAPGIRPSDMRNQY